MALTKLKIKTRYQRMSAACCLAKSLMGHPDPKVSNVAHEILTLLGAPATTLNNVIDGFEPSSIRIILDMLENRATPEDNALANLRQARREILGESL